MNVALLGIPLDLGAGRRGVDMGASALRNARLARAIRELGHDVTDLGDIAAPIAETVDPFETHSFVFVEQIAEVCAATYHTLNALPADTFGLCMGGDHSVAMGTVSGMARGERMGLIWVDAHTDFNTPESSPSGNIHGMPVAHLLGLGDSRLYQWAAGWHMRPEDIVMIGIRSVDRKESLLLQEHGIAVYTMKDIDQKGMPYITEAVKERLQHLSRWHVSFDADALDPTITPGVGTPVKGGLSYREAHFLMEILAETGKVGSMDIVEVNPILDLYNQTAITMVEMAQSLLGKNIL